MTRLRTADLLKGGAYALLLDLVWVALVLLLSGAAWVLVLFWAMVVLAITGITIAEERYLLTAGFWLGQVSMFTLWLLGVFKALQLVVP